MKPSVTIGWLIATAIAIACLGQFTDADLFLARLVHGQGEGGFALRHVWWTEKLGHDYMRRLLILVGVCVVLAAFGDWVRPRMAWSTQLRRTLRVAALSALLVPLAVTAAKSASWSHCPWDLIEFGGNEPYVRLFDAVPEFTSAGRCMPAGHASSALWLISLALFWLPLQRRKAAAMALAMLAFGLALGAIQQLRGAHFLTHTLWSAWIACAVVAIVERRVMRSVDPMAGGQPSTDVGKHAL